MKKFLGIQSGGTICQEKNENGVYVPVEGDYFYLAPEIYKNGKIDSFPHKAIDSTNMGTQHRKEITEIVKQNYLDYDGFVIVQGTDSLAESASAINYMIQNSKKPIILTGSQKPIKEYGTDARDNLYNSFKFASKGLPGVWVVFGDKILRGSRTVKEHSTDFNAFNSTKQKPFGLIYTKEHYFSLDIERSLELEEDVSYFTSFDTGVETYVQNSGNSTNVLENIVRDDSVKGIVVGGLGVGNIRDEYVDLLIEARERNKPCVVVTNCQGGSVDMETYEVGAKSSKYVIPGFDLTREAAVQKLMYSLGKARYGEISKENLFDYVKKIIYTPIGRDITLPKPTSF